MMTWRTEPTEQTVDSTDETGTHTGMCVRVHNRNSNRSSACAPYLDWTTHSPQSR